MQVPAAGAGSPVPAFAGPHWGGAEEAAAPWGHGTAVALGRPDEGKMKGALGEPCLLYGGHLDQA